jgi:hypothetical protein
MKVDMDQIARAKRIVRDHTVMFDAALKQGQFSNRWDAISSDFHWRSMHPFYEKKGIEAVVSEFWGPLSQSLRHLHRREDVFFAGENDVDGGGSVWTCSMGHFVGLFDADWLAIPKTGRIAHLRYAEFMKVEEDRIVESALFFDLIGLMHEAGVYPLPPMTGSYFIYPGPATHDGLLLAPQNKSAGHETLALINRMIEDLSGINHLTDEKCPPELLARTWREDMVWYGPCGIGASYTIERYQKQHQYPFRMNLDDKTYHGHIARFAEGIYGGFFGWANLSNRNMGGFLGLPEAATSSEMRVVDVYRRDGNKLAENWVIIDIPYYLKQQGLDVLTRLQEVRS